ncbi:hypothetical protein D3C78_1872270 [compost metagenome]
MDRTAPAEPLINPSFSLIIIVACLSLKPEPAVFATKYNFVSKGAEVIFFNSAPSLKVWKLTFSSLL